MLRQSQAAKYTCARIPISLLKKHLRDLISCHFHSDWRLCCGSILTCRFPDRRACFDSPAGSFTLFHSDDSLNPAHGYKRPFTIRRHIRGRLNAGPDKPEIQTPRVQKAAGRQKLYLDWVQAILPAMKPRNLFTELCLGRNDRTGLRLTPSLLISSRIA